MPSEPESIVMLHSVVGNLVCSVQGFLEMHVARATLLGQHPACVGLRQDPPEHNDTLLLTSRLWTKSPFQPRQGNTLNIERYCTPVQARDALGM